MNFRTTSTIEEQMNHVKKYAPLLLDYFGIDG